MVNFLDRRVKPMSVVSLFLNLAVAATLFAQLQFPNSVTELAEALAKANSDTQRTALLADKDASVTPALVQALIEQGDRLRAQGDYNRAIATHQLAQTLAEKINDSDGAAEAAGHVGDIDAVRGDYAAALESFQKQLAIYEAHGDKRRSALAVNSLGMMYQAQGQQTLALDYFRRALSMLEDSGTEADIALVRSRIGFSNYSLGIYEQALDDLQQAARIFERLGDGFRVSRVLNDLGLVQHETGDYDQALASFEKALAIDETRQDKEGIPARLNNIARVYRVRGNYAAALEYYQKALALAEAVESKNGIATILFNIGSLYHRQGDYDQALEYYQKALPLRQELGNRSRTAGVLDSMGFAYSSRNEYPLATEYLEKSLAMSESAGDKAESARALNNLGLVHQAQGLSAEAMEDYEKSLAMRESMGNRSGVALTLTNIAGSYKSRGLDAEALDAASRAADLAQQIGDAEALAKAQFAAGEAYRGLHNADQARAAFEKSIAAIETLRSNSAGGEEEQQRFFESRIHPYHAMIDLLISEGRVAEAFNFAERARARVLLDVLESGRVDITKAMTAAEQNDERRLNAALVSLNAQIIRESAARQPDERRLSTLKAQLEKARLDLTAFQSTLYAAHPELRTQRGEAAILSLQDAADLVSPTRALLEYVVTDQRTYLFVITKKTGKTEAEIHAYTLPVKRDQLTSQVEGYREQLASRNLGFRASAKRLYATLLQPAQAQLRGKSSFVISPDHKLWDLPFQALIGPDGRFVIEAGDVSYTPSLTVLNAMERQRAARTAGDLPYRLLAVGNPLIPKQRGIYDPLPEAEEEVRALGQVYGAAHSRVYVGATAREDRVKSEASQARVLHFATHGVLDNVSPMYSHLLLSPGDANNDGLLEAREIMQMDLKADLAVLSACETARGRFGAGEGMIGLTWALFVAGVPSTVVSQWKVESASTRDLMLHFHRGLKSSRWSKAESLRQAALKLMHSSETSHPFYWAGFVLIGDER